MEPPIERVPSVLLLHFDSSCQSNCFSTRCSEVIFPKCAQRPRPRSGHRIVSHGRFIYSFGGFNPNGPENRGMYPEAWQFCTKTKKWTVLSRSGPYESASHSMAFINQCVVTWGGTGYPWGHRISNSLNVYCVPSDTWRTLPCTGALPSHRYGHTTHLHGDYMYVIGGKSKFWFGRDWMSLGSYEGLKKRFIKDPPSQQKGDNSCYQKLVISFTLGEIYLSADF